MKLDSDILDDEMVTYINSLIDAAVVFAEGYTKRKLIDSNFTCYLDYFISGCEYEIRLSPLNSITSLQYYVDGSLQTIDSANYYTTVSSRFKRLCPVIGYEWPEVDQRMQAVVLTCVAGYTSATMPYDLKAALLWHVAAMYVNRGDCTPPSCDGCSLPVATRNIYNAYRIKDLFYGV